jgi:Ger(x)C family germination protein
MKKSLLLCVISLLLAGCWDQRLLKDANVVSIIGMDETTEGEIELTVAVPKGSGGENQDLIAHIESATGETVRNSRNNLNKKMGKDSDASKNEFLLLGEELVKDEIFSVLDTFYRDPSSALNTKVAITEGKAKDFIHLEIEGEPLINSYFLELIKSAETDTTVPALNLQSLCSLIFDIGQDFALPYLRIADDKKSAEIIGLVMFHEEQLSGMLTSEEGMMFLLLADQKENKVQMTEKVGSGSNSDRKNYVTISIKKATRKLDIQSKGGQGIQVNLQLELHANVIEYPKDQVNKKSTITHLNQKLSELLTKRAEETVSKMQEANSDLLGIGRILMARHPEVWKKTDWKTEYPKIQIKSKVNVTVDTHGIIN